MHSQNPPRKIMVLPFKSHLYLGYLKVELLNIVDGIAKETINNRKMLHEGRKFQNVKINRFSHLPLCRTTTQKKSDHPDSGMSISFQQRIIRRNLCN